MLCYGFLLCHIFPTSMHNLGWLKLHTDILTNSIHEWGPPFRLHKYSRSQGSRNSEFVIFVDVINIPTQYECSHSRCMHINDNDAVSVNEFNCI
jgi:hypothetical protein